MCLILLAWQSHPDYPLVIAANRDEFYARPAAPLGWWSQVPSLAPLLHADVLAGRDLADQALHTANAQISPPGTWMGLARNGRFAAVTNYRAPSEKRTDTRSRGELSSHFLIGDDSPSDYIAQLQPRSHVYNGFNLLVSDLRQLWCYSNRGEARALGSGVYGLSNHLLDTPWPKVRHRIAAFAETLAADRGRLDASHAYLQLLADSRQATDDELPRTGVSLEWERLLSAAFIRSPLYGTRASTVLRIRHDGQFDMLERSFDAHGQLGEQHVQGQLQLASVWG